MNHAEILHPQALRPSTSSQRHCVVPVSPPLMQGLTINACEPLLMGKGVAAGPLVGARVSGVVVAARRPRPTAARRVPTLVFFGTYHRAVATGHLALLAVCFFPPTQCRARLPMR